VTSHNSWRGADLGKAIRKSVEVVEQVVKNKEQISQTPSKHSIDLNSKI